MENEIMVSICMISYNHEKYIRKALQSILNQKTDFKYEILIHDDASPDNTAKIIKEYELKYPDIIKPIYQKENQFSKGNRMITKQFNYPRVKGKYVAFCECDDYWIDEYKLQKQVDFLESHNNAISVAHKYAIVDQNENIVSYSHENEVLDRFFNKSDALRLKSGLLHLNTLMFRATVLQDKHFLKGFDECCILGSHTYIIYYLTQLSDIYIMKDCMSAWRCVREKGGTSYQSRVNDHRISYSLKLLEMYCNYRSFFKKEYDFNKIIKKMFLSTLYIIINNNEENINKSEAIYEAFSLVSKKDIIMLPLEIIKKGAQKIFKNGK